MGVTDQRWDSMPDGEALLYYQHALEAELQRVRIELSRIGLPGLHGPANAHPSGVAATG